MIKGVFIALAIMVGCFLFIVPIVHFLAIGASPFIGGYIGISSARANPLSPVAKSITFGLLLAGMVLIISIPSAVVVTIVTDLGRFFWILWIGVAILAIYTASMSALGSMYAILKTESASQDTGPKAVSG